MATRDATHYNEIDVSPSLQQQLLLLLLLLLHYWCFLKLFCISFTFSTEPFGFV